MRARPLPKQLRPPQRGSERKTREEGNNLDWEMHDQAFQASVVLFALFQSSFKNNCTEKIRKVVSEVILTAAFA